MAMAMISPSPEAPEQQDLTPSERSSSFAAAAASDNSGKNRASLFGEDEGVHKKPQARRCPRLLLVGPTRPLYLAAWAHPFWASWLSSLRSSFHVLPSEEKSPWFLSFY